MNPFPMPFLQQIMIETLQRVCHEDARVEAAMLYGSFAYGEADEFSDLDVLLYFDDEALKALDQQAWAAQIHPIALSYINDFGIRAIIFDNLVRGEFHFDPASDIPKIERYRGIVWFPSSAILLDRHGKLAHHLQVLIEKPQRDTPEVRATLCSDFLNRFLFSINVLKRSEVMRAVELLVGLNDLLLQMIRLDEKQTDHWITPTRAAETELSAAAYARLIQCTAPGNKSALWEAYRAAWQLGKTWIDTQNQMYNALITKFEQRLNEYYPENERPHA